MPYRLGRYWLEHQSEMDVAGTDELMTCRQISVKGNVNPHLRLSIRLLITMLAGALAITAIITAMAPQAWGILNSHSETPVSLSQFSGLAQRSILLDVNGQPQPSTTQLFWAGFSGMAYLPSTVVPAGLTASGMPSGVQIIGPSHGDMACIDFAQRLENEYMGFLSPPYFD